MEQDSKHSKKLIVAFFFATIMILSSLVLVTAIPVGQEYVGMPQISGISNNIGQSINVTFSRVSYRNEPKMKFFKEIHSMNRPIASMDDYNLLSRAAQSFGYTKKNEIPCN